METLTNLVLLFFVYSFVGWCIEVTLKFIQYHRFINRGFFTGPICPIYGSGAVLITLAVGVLSPVESAYGTTFVLSFILCGAVEYFTSYIMEKRFHARWWDYSQKPMNLHGRIWIGNLILFGLGGVAIMHLINPLLYRLFILVSLDARRILAGMLLAVFAVDYVMTHFILKLVKSSVESSEADSTEAINREIRLLLSDRNIFYRRFADAYPDVIYRTERINARLTALREESERIRLEAEHRLEEQKAQLVSSMEPSAMIRISLLDQQNRLIELLYDEQSASEPEKALKREIEANQARLESRPLSRLANLARAAEKI